MLRNSPLSCLAALAACAGAMFAQNVVVLPTFQGAATANAIIYSGSPLAPAGTFTASTESNDVLVRATSVAGDVKYYVVARSGTNTVTILNGAFAPIGPALNIGQNPAAAAVTPDGRRFILVVGNRLRIYDTGTDTEIPGGQNLDVGLGADGIAISSDSRHAYVIASAGQKVTCVDLVANTILGEIALPGLQAGQGFIAAGLNGMIYVSAADRVLEVDPRGATFNSSNIRRQFPFPGARVGRLHFTPDGARALAVNNAPQSGQLLFYFNLDFRGPSVSSISSADPWTGYVIEKIFIGETNRAFLITSSQSAAPRRLLQATLPDAPADAGQIAQPTIQEASFGSLGTIPIVDSIAFSNEKPNASRMFISAPLNLLAPAASNSVYTVQLGGSPNVTGTVTLDFLPGPIRFVGPASTASGDPASGRIPFNFNQPNLAPGGRSLPFGVRVIGTSGQPLFNFPVTFTSGTPAVQLQFDEPLTVNTNADGLAFNTVVAPAAAGTYSVIVTSGGFSAAFTFTVTSSTGGGGGGGGGGQPGAAGITIVSGNGQVVSEGNFAPNPMVIEVRDAAGAPVANTQAVWTITQGAGTFRDGTLGESSQQFITVTNAQGRTQNTYLAGIISALSQSFSTTEITVTSTGASATLYATAILGIFQGGTVAPPTALLLAPSNEPLSIVGRVGQTLTGAVRVRVTASSGPQTGAVMPFVGVRVYVPGLDGQPETDNDPTRGPAVECAPSRVALTGADGLATCDVRLFGRTGNTRMVVNIGEFSVRTILLQVNPGEPGRLRIVNGDNQSGNANENLPAPLTVELDDGGGNLLAGQPINWSVLTGNATLVNSTTTTNSQGQASNALRLGAQPGIVQVRATAAGGTQPNVTFNLRTNVTLGNLRMVSGDRQTAVTNANFAQPLVVQIVDTQQLPVSGQVVTFTVASGSVVLSSTTATTNTSGQANIQVRAGSQPGPVVINVTVQGLALVQTFSLTVVLPGPVVNALDFFNAASGERGGVVPGSVYIMEGRGLADDLTGCVTQNNVIGPWHSKLRGVELQFGATLAPLLNVCNLNDRQFVTFQAPFELAPGGTVAVTVRVGTGSTVVNGVQVLDLQPGVFETTEVQNRRYVVALRPNGSYVNPENPAHYGEVIRVYITGAGFYSPAAFTGVTGVSGQNVIAPVVVGLNDAGVRLVSATYWEGMIGIAEIAFEVPQGTPTGSARPLGVLLVRPNGQFVFPGNSPTIAIAP